MIVFLCQVNLVMARAAAATRLFVGLAPVEVAATIGRHAVDPTSVFLIQKETGAVLASGRRQSPNPTNLAVVHNDRSRARQQLIKRKLDRIAVPKVFGDPPDVRREQKAWLELKTNRNSTGRMNVMRRGASSEGAFRARL